MGSSEKSNLAATTWNHFGDRLAQAVQARQSATCVGLDPRWASLPQTLQANVAANDWQTVAERTEQFCREVIDAVADIVPVVKPQAAFFEQLGWCGMQALANTIDYARQKGLIVLLDGKRGDIGSTAEGYAEAYLGPTSAWQCDALTINPYLGADTLEPFVKRSRETGSGVIVLVKTSNPGSSYIQDVNCSDGRIYHKVADTVQQHCLADLGKSGYGSVGAVTGATYPEELAELRARMPNVWLLIPGYGAQGAGAAEVRAGFDQNGLGAIVNSSRGIIFAYGSPDKAGTTWQDKVRQAALTMNQELASK